MGNKEKGDWAKDIKRKSTTKKLLTAHSELTESKLETMKPETL
jgi:hypothetical protein